VPAGKIENGESPRDAVARETFEETGIQLNEECLKFIGKFFVRKPHVDYIYHMYHENFSQLPNVCICDERDEYRWATIEEVNDLPIMSGGIETLHHLKALANKPKIPRKPFYFVRHGETDVNANSNIKRVDYDLPLNNKGRMQADSARKALVKLPLNSVCFSPIQRAVETKNILMRDIEVEHFELDDLSECKAHIWTKMIKLEKGCGYTVCNEVDSFLQRSIRGLSSSIAKKGSTLIVAHGGIHWALCYHLMIENHPWKIGNCEIVHFQPIGDEEWTATIC